MDGGRRIKNMDLFFFIFRDPMDGWMAAAAAAAVGMQTHGDCFVSKRRRNSQPTYRVVFALVPGYVSRGSV